MKNDAHDTTITVAPTDEPLSFWSKIGCANIPMKLLVKERLFTIFTVDRIEPKYTSVLLELFSSSWLCFLGDDVDWHFLCIAFAKNGLACFPCRRSHLWARRIAASATKLLDESVWSVRKRVMTLIRKSLPLINRRVTTRKRWGNQRYTHHAATLVPKGYYSH